MKTVMPFRNVFLRIFGLILTSILTLQPSLSQGWYNSSWSHRSPIAISNPGSTSLINFQVEIRLSSTNFDFTGVLTDGSDIRLTSSDGITPIPFWIESWNYGTSAVIWANVPEIPVTGTTVYAYYGNPSPEVSLPDSVETPPTGPYAKYVGNPIAVPGLCANQVLPENLVYEDGTYYVIVSNRCVAPATLSIVSSTDLVTWVHEGIIQSAAIAGDPGRYFDAPCLVKADGTWYIFYSSYYGTWSESNTAPIGIARSTTGTIMGPYVELNRSLLTCGALDTWDDARVSEPHIIQRDNGDWVMIYMGDAAASGGFVEQIGIAVSATGIEGPYIKSAGNPVIPFGPPGSLDAGTVADPWVIRFGDTYYIGYTASPTKSGWNTTYVTTTDWINFPKSNTVILNQGPTGSWDATSAFRGAVTRVGDTYIFPFTGQGSAGFQFGIATQPVYTSPYSDVNNVYDVFEFYDGFDSTALNTNKWSIYRQGVQTGEAIVENGQLRLRANSNASSDIITITGNKPFGSGMLLEVSAMHPDANGSGTRAAEVGFGNAIRSDVVRIFDYNSTTNFIKQSLTNGQGNVFDNLMAFGLNTTDFLLHRIFLNSATRVDFALENTEFEPITANIPSIALPPWLMCAALPNQSTLLVDWVRVRKFTGADPVVGISEVEGLNTQWTGTVNSDWNNPGNWTAGVPGEWSTISVPASAHSPVFAGSLTVNTGESLFVDAGGALTVTGDLIVNGQVIIGSTLTSSGSLIVSGNSTGNITYNRQLKAGSDAGSDWHLAAPPVVTNSNSNTGKVGTVYQWSELTGTWTATGVTSTLAGRGYNIRQETASDGVISFTGPLVNSDLAVDVSSPYVDAVGPDESYFDRAYVSGRSLVNLGGRGWNLLGNPYSSAIAAEEFILANYNPVPEQSQFDPNHVALYLFDGTTRRYYYLANETGWPSGSDLGESHLQAGQGFFVLAMNDNSQFQFTRAMREHSTTTPVLKSGGDPDNRWPGLQLNVRHASGEVSTTVVYSGSMTTGVDPGFDIGLFKSGQEVEIYTSLVMKDNAINYTRQALPLSGADTLVIPIGIDYKDGGEVTFSATTVPVEGRRFWLEDRAAGVITDLSLKSYTVALPSDTYGTGRFFIIASANTPTGKVHPEAADGDIRIWVSGGRLIIHGSVSEGSLCELFDIRGGKLAERHLDDGGMNNFDLPAGLHGVVVVRVTGGHFVVTGKVVVP